MSLSPILVVEDEDRLRMDIVDFLCLTGLNATGVGSAAELRQEMAGEAPPRVLILDVGLPDDNGFDLATEIRASHSCGIVMLTGLEGTENRIRGFDSGADVYLVKDTPLREIEACVRSLLRRTGETPPAATMPAAAIEEPVWILDSRGWLLFDPDRQALKLTATEFAFLNALCTSTEDVSRREDLVARLARPKVQFDNRHLDAVVSRLRRKIGDGTGREAPIRSVYGVGYTFTAPVSIR
ncbi:response regulator transcription factor [Chachezhania sediminis]|uniref:response regulator transcription factor n=1 Tax=Chachezhania sediminis TaxID=2599291 RepID=UPI00131BC596|nr:response regulator transcription factor [Chachezhania sediminis]